VNTAMPLHVVNRTAEALNARRNPVNGSRVLIVGLAYKPNVDDERESPSYVLMNLLQERGAAVAYYDPYVPVVRPTREHPQWAGTRSVTWDRATIESYDAVIIATNHQVVNYQELADWAPCIVDTRNAMVQIKTKDWQVWKA
jgi:UDP-N-acetyl-D-glucosamine dehydrogenase